MATRTLHNDPRIVDLDIGGCKPFWSAPEASEACFTEAHAMLTFMAVAFEVSEGLGDQAFVSQNDGLQYENSIQSLRDNIKANALNGIARLVAMGMYCGNPAMGGAA